MRLLEIQALQEDDYARKFIVPANGIKSSTSFDTVNDRGVEQLLFVFTELQKKAGSVLPTQHVDLGDLVAIDGSFIDSVLSHLFARIKNGLMVQILSGLIIYLLLAIYGHEQHGEQVSIRRVRQRRNQIRNEGRGQANAALDKQGQRKRKRLKKPHAIF